MGDRVFHRGKHLNVARINEQTTWPMADDKLNGLAHTVRYGTPEEIVAARYSVAEVIEAYRSLVQNTQRRRSFYGNRIKRVSNEAPPADPPVARGGRG